jgi:hypothetical protein
MGSCPIIENNQEYLLKIFTGGQRLRSRACAPDIALDVLFI